MPAPHASNLWPEPADNGGAPTVGIGYWVKSGADWTLSATGPEEAALFLVGSDYILIDLTPVLGVYYDVGGNAQAIDPDTTPRLAAIALRGSLVVY